MNPKVDFYFHNKWEKETRKLRTIILECGLTEELKWGCPCYTLGKKNIVLIHDFKEYCALLFFKGALLSDPNKLLIQQSENVQAARQLRFTDLKQITRQASVIKAYVYEAIEVEKAGLKVPLKTTAEFKTPVELQTALDKNAKLRAAFEALTPGRQRAYKLYFSAPKQAKTRETRIEKSIPKIIKGMGLND